MPMWYYMLSDQGSREYMEDQYTVAQAGDYYIAAVFDGHSGGDMSAYCSKMLTKHVGHALDKERGSTTDSAIKIVVQALNTLDAGAQRDLGDSKAGTTACVVLVHPKSIVTGNIGDSRAILGGGPRVYELSKDHKPSDASEQDRIVRSGGFITPPHYTDGVHRVMGRLSLSRAIGDWQMRPWVSGVPEVTLHPRTRLDKFVLLATDGVWDVMTSQEVAGMIQRDLATGKHPKSALHHVLSECRKRGSGDNITLLLLDIGKQRLTPGPL